VNSFAQFYGPLPLSADPTGALFRSYQMADYAARSMDTPGRPSYGLSAGRSSADIAGDISYMQARIAAAPPPWGWNFNPWMTGRGPTGE
jgi:hypothetical protein